MTELEEAIGAARLGFECVNRENFRSFVRPGERRATAAAERALVPTIDDLKSERRVHADRRMQTRRRLPSAEANARHKLAERAGRWSGTRRPLQTTICRLSVMPRTSTCKRSTEESTNRAVPRGSTFFAEHVPRFDGLPQFDFDVLVADRSAEWEAEFEVGIEPFLTEVEACFLKIGQHVGEVLRQEMRQHDLSCRPVFQRTRSFWYGFCQKWGEQAAEQQLLRQAHSRMRRHFEGPQFDQPQASGTGVGRKQFVDAELGPMRVAGEIHEEIAEQPVGQPRRHERVFRQLLEGRFEFVYRFVPGFVDARSLARRGPTNKPEKRYDSEGLVVQ